MGGTMSRKLVVTLALMAVCIAKPVRAEVQSGDQGLGLIFGSPIGLTYKYFYTHTMAVDGGIGVIGDKLAIYATHLWHDFSLIPKPSGVDAQLPFYFGVGARLRFMEDPRFGIRTITGISFMHNKRPFELFGELGPFIRLTPDVGVSMDGGVGFRYYFRALRPSA
jgi:hypothetical protein